MRQKTIEHTPHPASKPAHLGHPRRNEVPNATAARSQLLRMHRRIFDRLQAEIEGSLGGIPAALEAYYACYDRELARYERPASRRELFEVCSRSDLIYCGDYHSLPESQRTATTLIHELARRRPNLLVALEMVHSVHQEALDAYLDDLLDEDAFLREIDYARTWAFPWPPYRRLLSVCRDLGLRVLAINSTGDGPGASGLLLRDLHAARRIVRETRARPNAPIFVLDGDLHVASGNLPLIVRSLLQSDGLARRDTIVHQNADAIWWDLAGRGLERSVEVVRVRPRVFCVLSATPISKLQSYVAWQQDHLELSEWRDPEWGGPTVGPSDDAERITDLVRTVAEFLGLDASGLDGFTVYTPRDLDALRSLARTPGVDRASFDAFRTHVASGRSYFVPGVNIIYLADRRLYGAAEEATHYLNCAVSGAQPEERSARDGYYVRVVREALGFFGSRLIDPKRACDTEEAMRAYLARVRGKRLERSGRGRRALYRLVLRHIEAERIDARRRRGGAGGRRERRRGPQRYPFYRHPPSLQDATSHLLGYILGDKLHQAVLTGQISRRSVRELFLDPLPPGRAEELYLSLAARLRGVRHDAPDPRDQLLRRAG